MSDFERRDEDFNGGGVGFRDGCEKRRRDFEGRF